MKVFISKVLGSILSNEQKSRDFKVGLAEALSESMGETLRKKFAVQHDPADQIIHHDRFLRS
ncbi:MAG: hypothetical protein OXF20_00145 [Gammaproteobacteria bacterium]|nr:hypothetical protein [Gammaproteobacteria bacterium]